MPPCAFVLGNGGGEGGIYPQRREKGAECSHFQASYILIKLIKFFGKKGGHRGIII